MPWTVADASTVRTSGPAELVVQTMTYAAGQTSGWHSHPGLHLVSVISGTLTVYGPDCQPRSYGPGEPYIGGDSLHLARNEGEVPVEMGVTYLSAPGQSMAGFRQPHQTPATCPVQ
jgi:quercetin dioxygenase-like cupin family protein